MPVLLAFALLVFFTGAPGFAQVAGLKQLTGHVPEAVSTAPLVGDYPPANRMILALGLPLRDSEGLNALLKNLYNPKAPSTGGSSRPTISRPGSPPPRVITRLLFNSPWLTI